MKSKPQEALKSRKWLQCGPKQQNTTLNEDLSNGKPMYQLYTSSESEMQLNFRIYWLPLESSSFSFLLKLQNHQEHTTMAQKTQRWIRVSWLGFGMMEAANEATL